MCQDCQQKESNSSFLFGIFIGAIIASLIAILIYKNQKTDVFEKLKKYLSDLLSPYLKTPTPTPAPAKKTSPKTNSSPKIATKAPSVAKSPSPSKLSPPKKDAGKIEVELPKNLKTYTPVQASKKTKPVKMFRKAKA